MSGRRYLQFMLILAGALASLGSTAVLARGGLARTEASSARHVEELPREVRNAVTRWQSACRMPLAAKSSFAHYLQAGEYHLVALHFHDLTCAERSFCDSTGCLHQVYLSNGGPYRLAFSASADEVTLKLVDRMPAIEVNCRNGRQNGAQLLRWDGRHFTPTPRGCHGAGQQ